MYDDILEFILIYDQFEIHNHAHTNMHTLAQTKSTQKKTFNAKNALTFIFV